MNWQELSSASHYRTALAIQQELEVNNTPAARAGIQELIEALTRSDRRALKSHLARLMTHIIKWKVQPEKRSRSWLATIDNAREEIADLQEETPSLTRDTVEKLWAKCFLQARRDAEAEMNQNSSIPALSWHEVFEEAYADEEFRSDA